MYNTPSKNAERSRGGAPMSRSSRACSACCRASSRFAASRCWAPRGARPCTERGRPRAVGRRAWRRPHTGGAHPHLRRHGQGRPAWARTTAVARALGWVRSTAQGVRTPVLGEPGLVPPHAASAHRRDARCKVEGGSASTHVSAWPIMVVTIGCAHGPAQGRARVEKDVDRRTWTRSSTRRRTGFSLDVYRNVVRGKVIDSFARLSQGDLLGPIAHRARCINTRSRRWGGPELLEEGADLLARIGRERLGVEKWFARLLRLASRASSAPPIADRSVEVVPRNRGAGGGHHHHVARSSRTSSRRFKAKRPLAEDLGVAREELRRAAVRTASVGRLRRQGGADALVNPG